MSAAACNERAGCPIRDAETKPLRSYLDRTLFGVFSVLFALFSFLLLRTVTKMDDFGKKIEENTLTNTALVERMEAMKEWRIQADLRLSRIERGKKGAMDE